MNPSARHFRDELVPGPQREFPYCIDDFRRIAAILLEDTGITLSEAKAPMVYSRLARRVRDLGLRNFQDYCELVADPGGDERRRMTAALTTNITRFFREPHHFEHLTAKVLPDLIDQARQGARVRLWSAGCSSGEEPYSIALTLLALMPDAERYDIKILAIDLDNEMLERGREGRYSNASVEAVPAKLRDAWFRRESENGSLPWRAGPTLRNLVAFRELNLVGPWPMRGTFQAIFCRNTVIYFEEAEQQRVWTRMAAACAPEGFLYIGHSERMPSQGLFAPSGLTIFRRTGDK